MPVLQDPKHEAFAQHRASGKSQAEAYKLAGYKGDRTAASRLSTNVNIQARIEELTTQVAKKAVDNSAFEAKTMFEAVLQDIEDAKKAGDHKTAADLRKFFISCFGYEDSPTLTHEHVKGKSLPQDKPEGEGGEAPQQPDRTNVVMLAQAIKKAQRRAG
jgi:hypothetical protein